MEYESTQINLCNYIIKYLQMVDSQQPLLTPFKLGDLELPNRIVMAALVRCRGDKATSSPSELYPEYYSSRASTGLIITECSPVSQIGNAYPGTAGIYSEEQTQAWKKTVDAVHEKGGRIFIQLIHGGRVVPNEALSEGAIPIAPSPITKPGSYNIVFKTPVNFTQPKEATVEDIKELLGQYKQAALNAKAAGFDGIEIHAANGYLIEQFLKDATNKRTDDYGGSVENRVRFLSEVIDAVTEVYEAGRVGVKVSPQNTFNEISTSDPLELLAEIIKVVNQKNIGFIEISEEFGKNKAEASQEFWSKHEAKSLRAYFKGQIKIPVVANYGIDQSQGN